MIDYRTLAGLPADADLAVAKARCRLFRLGPPDVLEKLDMEALAAGDVAAVYKAQLKVAAAAVKRLRVLLRADLSAQDRDAALTLLLDFLVLLRGAGEAVIPPELEAVL
jgi:hypothetical protein